MFSFTSFGISSLVDELKKPFIGLSVSRLPHGEIVEATILYADGSGLVITNRMNDLQPRGEMGSLSFKHSVTWPSDRKVEKLNGFEESFSLKKLISTDDDVEAESGLVFEGKTGNILTIASAVYPYSLFISHDGNNIIDEGKIEFPKNWYRSEKIF